MRTFSILSCLISVALCNGCVAVPAPEPISAEEVVRMSRESVPVEEILTKLRRSRTVYLLDAKKLIDLHSEGVDLEVLDYMLDSEREYIQRRAWHSASPYWWGHPGPWYWHPHYGYAYGPYWW